MAAVPACGYARTLGFVTGRPDRPWITGKTGRMDLWRLLTLEESWRMPPKGTNGLGGAVGEDDPALNTRAHAGVGKQMDFARLNTLCAGGFSEWVIGIPVGAGGEPHRNVDLATYRTYFNDKATAGDLGFYQIADAAAVTNTFVRWDHYREKLPPGIPAGRVAVASWYVNDEPVGRDSLAVAIRVRDGINNWDLTNGPADDADPAGVPQVAVHAGSADDYHGWVYRKCKTLANDFMDILIPRQNPPRTMKVLRWPNLYFDRVWFDATPGAYQAKGLGVAGYCRGSGQAFFFTTQGNPDTFEHEMGHSLFLAHFASGGITNFAWKQHAHAYPNCLMGYNSGSFNVPLPAAHHGANITITTNPRAYPCPKCLLKIRGWNEVKLPSNWTHPDVF